MLRDTTDACNAFNWASVNPLNAETRLETSFADRPIAVACCVTFLVYASIWVMTVPSGVPAARAAWPNSRILPRASERLSLFAFPAIVPRFSVEMP